MMNMNVIGFKGINKNDNKGSDKRIKDDSIEEKMFNNWSF